MPLSTMAGGKLGNPELIRIRHEHSLLKQAARLGFFSNQPTHGLFLREEPANDVGRHSRLRLRPWERRAGHPPVHPDAVDQSHLRMRGDSAFADCHHVSEDLHGGRADLFRSLMISRKEKLAVVQRTGRATDDQPIPN